VSGQQEQWERPERASQPDPSDSMLVVTQQPADGHERANGHGQAGITAVAEPTRPVRAAAEDAADRPRAPQTAPPAGDEPPVRRVDPPFSSPKPGSWADLRQRLERLPYGHPSSPYHVDGERKPPPPRLKHLELAPPGREPSATPGRFGFSDAGLADTGQSDQRTAGAATTDEAKPSATAPAAQVSSGQNLTDPVGQRPGAVIPENGTRHHGDEQPHTAAGRPRTPPEQPRTRAIQPRTSTGKPQTPADAVAGQPDPLSRIPEPVSGSHQPGATQGRSASAQAKSLPAGRGPGFSTNSTRPRLASDGSWSWGPARLTPEQMRIAQDGYERFRTAEGRDLFGGYGTSGLTAKLRQVEERLKHGGLAPHAEDHALLEIDVFRARFADMLRRHPDRSPELLASRVPGALSYAFVFGTDHYADGILLVQDALEARGFELQARKNSWSSVANRCVFTMWHDPLSELPFEVQFHTSASLEAQQLARTSVSLINDPRIPPEEAASLRSDLASAWAALPSPPGSAQIGDYRRYGSSAAR
jgi:hypothetical protein